MKTRKQISDNLIQFAGLISISPARFIEGILGINDNSTFGGIVILSSFIITAPITIPLGIAGMIIAPKK